MRKVFQSQMFCAYTLTSHLSYAIIISKCQLCIDETEKEKKIEIYHLYRIRLSVLPIDNDDDTLSSKLHK